MNQIVFHNSKVNKYPINLQLCKWVISHRVTLTPLLQPTHLRAQRSLLHLKSLHWMTLHHYQLSSTFVAWIWKHMDNNKSITKRRHTNVHLLMHMHLGSTVLYRTTNTSMCKRRPDIISGIHTHLSVYSYGCSH